MCTKKTLTEIACSYLLNLHRFVWSELTITGDKVLEAFNFEKERIHSFKNWPHDFVSEIVLAKTGFFHLGKKDRVQCQFCRVILYDWVKGDNEIYEHLKWSPRCPLLRRKVTANVPTESLEELLPLVDTTDECDCTQRFRKKLM